MQLKLKRVWSDGTSEMVFEPLDFMGKLAALVPPPRAPLVKYSGVFAPNHKLRKLVVPKRVELPPTESCESHGAESTAPAKTAPRLSWSQLMKRVFGVDVLTCSKCGAQGMQVIADYHPRRGRRQNICARWACRPRRRSLLPHDGVRSSSF